MTKEDKQLHAMFAAHAFGAMLIDPNRHADSAAAAAWNYADRMMRAREIHFSLQREEEAALSRPVTNVNDISAGDVLLVRYKDGNYPSLRFIYILSSMDQNITWSTSGFSAPPETLVQATMTGFAETTADFNYYYFKRDANRRQP